MSHDFTYQWTLPFEKSPKFGKLLQFVTISGDVYAMMLNQDGRVVKVPYNFLKAVADVHWNSSQLLVDE